MSALCHLVPITWLIQSLYYIKERSDDAADDDDDEDLGRRWR